MIAAPNRSASTGWEAPGSARRSTMPGSVSASARPMGRSERALAVRGAVSTYGASSPVRTEGLVPGNPGRPTEPRCAAVMTVEARLWTTPLRRLQGNSGGCRLDSAIVRNFFDEPVAATYDQSTLEEFQPATIESTVDLLAVLAGY